MAAGKSTAVAACPSAWQPRQAADLLPPQCSRRRRGCPRLCRLCPGSHAPSRLTACSAGGTFLWLVVTDEAFLILPLSSGLEHQRRWSDAFPYPLACHPFRCRQALHPSVLICPWKSGISTLVAFLSGFAAGESGIRLPSEAGAASPQPAAAGSAAGSPHVLPADGGSCSFPHGLFPNQRHQPTPALGCSSAMKPVSNGAFGSALFITASRG